MSDTNEVIEFLKSKGLNPIAVEEALSNPLLKVTIDFLKIQIDELFQNTLSAKDYPMLKYIHGKIVAYQTLLSIFKDAEKYALGQELPKEEEKEIEKIDETIEGPHAGIFPLKIDATEKKGGKK